MASEPVRPSVPKHRAARIVLALLGILLLLAALLIGWLGASESGTRAAFSLLDRFTGGALHAEGVRGRLASPLRLDRLTLRQKGRRIVLSDLRLDWHPLALAHSALDIDTLHIGHLAVIDNGGQQQTPPPALPDGIGLPLAVHVAHARIDGGDIEQAGSRLLGFAPLAFALDYDGKRYRLHLDELAITAPLAGKPLNARLGGDATISAAKPYPLRGSFKLSAVGALQQQAIDANGRVRLSGSLADLAIVPELQVNRATLDGRATLHPFAADKLGAVHLQARGLDLARFLPSLPQTALDLVLDSARDGSGKLQLRNAAAGPYDRHRLPLASFMLDFRRDGGAIDFEQIAARLGSREQAGGTITGSGSYRNQVLALALHADHVDLRQLDGSARSTSLAGDIGLRNANGKQEFTVALQEPLDDKRRIALDAHGTLADSVLALDRLALQAGPGRVDASAEVALAGDRHFSAEGRFDRFRLRELGDFPKLPSVDLNGNFTLHGARQPSLRAELKFDIHDSRLAGQPLLGNGDVQLRNERLQVRKFLIASGPNRLVIDGLLSQGDSQLRFDLQAPRLAQFGSELAGALNVAGTVGGSLERPHIQAHWRADHAHLPQQLQVDAMQGNADIALDRKQPFPLAHAKASLSARGIRRGTDHLASAALTLDFAPQPDAPLSLSLQTGEIAAGKLRASRLSVSADGSTGNQTLRAALDEQGQSWKLEANGGLAGLGSTPRWQGSISSFEADGHFDARLAHPAPLLVSAAQVRLDHLVLDAQSGQLTVEQFLRDSSGIVTSGRIERLQVAQLLQQFTQAPPVRTTLQLSGDWNVHIGDQLNGSVHLRRDSGDVTVLGSSPVTLGLRTLVAGATLGDGRAHLQLQLDGSRLGQVMVDAGTRIGNADSRVALAPDAPLDGKIHIDIPSLGWIGPLASPSLIVAGSLRSDVEIGGSIGAPRLSGSIQGRELRVDRSDLGLDLRQGTLQAEFQDDQLLLRELSFRSDKGKLTLSGPFTLRDGQPAAQLQLTADHYQLLDRVDRRLTLSGDSRIALQDKRASATGSFTVDSGYIDIGQADRPQLSDDVVVVGAKQKEASRLALALDVRVSLGDGVKITGRGLDGILTGKVRLVNDVGEPLQAYGTLAIDKGSFSAYGKELKIEEGEVRFNGPLDNPALTIRAMRRGQEVAAGVSVRGSVLAPDITLVSEPEVPDADKLSWLVLGHGLSSANTSDAGTLQSAAASLLSRSAAAGVQSRIASAVGLDTLSVGTSDDTLQQRIVTLGKQISSRLYLSYQQGLQTANSVVQLRYLLTPKLSLEAEAGARSALSLFYNLTFD